MKKEKKTHDSSDLAARVARLEKALSCDLPTVTTTIVRRATYTRRKQSSGGANTGIFTSAFSTSAASVKNRNATPP